MMNTQLSFDIASFANSHTYEIELFATEKWNKNSESLLSEKFMSFSG